MNKKPSAAYLLAQQPDFIEYVNSFNSVSQVATEYTDYSYETVRRAVHIVLKGYDPVYEKQDVTELSAGQTDVYENEGKSWNVTIPRTTICTLEEFIEKRKIDTRIWRNSRFQIKEWEQGAKNADGKLIKQPLYSISATFVRNDEAIKAKDAFEDLLDDCRKHAPNMFHKPVNKDNMSGNLLEISCPDLHLGKLAWGEEAGEDYDSDIASSRFRDAVATLVQYAEPFECERILLPLGNDFFNIDGSSGATTAGTPQDCDTRWKKMFRMGRLLVTDVVNWLTTIAPVDIIVVPGNHDMEAAWHMGEALSCYYHNNGVVTVSNEAKWRKYVTWGDCLLGFTHGDKEPLKNLPLIMATEVPELWGKSTFREFHLGHFHTKRDMVSQPVGEFNGVKVCMIPSLSSNDNWHSSKGYGAQRAAEAFVWNTKKGRIANFSYSP